MGLRARNGLQLRWPNSRATQARSDEGAADDLVADRWVRASTSGHEGPSARYERAEALVEALDRAQLSAPEIPMPIRLFAPEAGMLGLVLTFFILISRLMIALRPDSQIDTMVPILVLFGVFLSRVLQTNSEARRLARAGFLVHDVMKDIRVVDERGPGDTSPVRTRSCWA